MINFKKFYEKIEEKDKNEIFNNAVGQICKKFYTDEVRDVTHEYDPEYDCSGNLITIKKNHTLSDYKNFEEFLEKYTGETTASYISGCGLFHKTYKEKMEDLIRDSIYEYCKKNLYEKSDKKISIEDFWDYIIYDCDPDFFDDLQLPMEYEIIDKIEKLKDKPLFLILDKYRENNKNS